MVGKKRPFFLKGLLEDQGILLFKKESAGLANLEFEFLAAENDCFHSTQTAHA